MKKNLTCKTSMTPPYLRLDFWMNSDHHWWNKPIYAQRVKDRMNKLIDGLVLNERNNAKL